MLVSGRVLFLARIANLRPLGWSLHFGSFLFTKMSRTAMSQNDALGTKNSSHVLSLQIKPLSAKLGGFLVSVVPSPCAKKGLDVLLNMMYRRRDVANPDI